MSSGLNFLKAEPPAVMLLVGRPRAACLFGQRGLREREVLSFPLSFTVRNCKNWKNRAGSSKKAPRSQHGEVIPAAAKAPQSLLRGCAWLSEGPSFMPECSPSCKEAGETYGRPSFWSSFSFRLSFSQLYG